MKYVGLTILLCFPSCIITMEKPITKPLNSAEIYQQLWTQNPEIFNQFDGRNEEAKTSFVQALNQVCFKNKNEDLNQIGCEAFMLALQADEYTISFLQSDIVQRKRQDICQRFIIAGSLIFNAALIIVCGGLWSYVESSC